MLKDMLDIRDVKIAEQLAAGTSVKQVAEQFSLTPNRVSEIAKKDKSREIIERETKKLLDLVPGITSQLSSDLELSGRLSQFLRDPASEPSIATSGFSETKEILEFQKQTYKKQQDVMKAVGIFPTNSTNIFIQQIYNDNRKQVLSPEVFQALSGLFGKLGEDDEIEDAEFCEVKSLELEQLKDGEDEDESEAV